MSLMKLLFSLCHCSDSDRAERVCLLQYEYQDESMQGSLHLGLEQKSKLISSGVIMHLVLIPAALKCTYNVAIMSNEKNLLRHNGISKGSHAFETKSPAR